VEFGTVDDVFDRRLVGQVYAEILLVVGKVNPTLRKRREREERTNSGKYKPREVKPCMTHQSYALPSAFRGLLLARKGLACRANAAIFGEMRRNQRPQIPGA
jgi:hypothetical protein